MIAILLPKLFFKKIEFWLKPFLKSKILNYSNIDVKNLQNQCPRGALQKSFLEKV